jgi:hypothetical protein
LDRKASGPIVGRAVIIEIDVPVAAVDHAIGVKIPLVLVAIAIIINAVTDFRRARIHRIVAVVAITSGAGADTVSISIIIDGDVVAGVNLFIAGISGAGFSIIACNGDSRLAIKRRVAIFHAVAIDAVIAVRIVRRMGYEIICLITPVGRTCNTVVDGRRDSGLTTG